MKIQSAVGITTIALLAASLAFPLTIGFAGLPTHGQLYYNGTVVCVITPPAKTDVGLDNLYVVPGQLAVTATAPGNPDYHGGHWNVMVVTWNQGVTPKLLTSEGDVLAAESAGLLTVTADPASNFICPIVSC